MKNPISLVFYLLTNVDSNIALTLFYSNGPRLLGDSDTPRRRPYKAVYYYYEKLVFYQLTSLFPVMLKFEVSLEVEFVLEFEVEFDIEFVIVELLELESMSGGFLIEELLVIELLKDEERDISPIEEGSLSLLNN